MYDNDSFEDKVKFFSSLGLALHKYGLAAHNLERVISNVADSLGLYTEVFSTPNILLLCSKCVKTTEASQVVRRVTPGNINLELLEKIDHIGDMVIAGEVALADVTLELEQILQEKPLYSRLLRSFAHSFIAFTISIFFGASVLGIILSSSGGFIVGVICAYLTKIFKISRFLEFIVAFIISFLSHSLFHFIPHFNTNLVNISSIIFLVPGVSLTIALAELANENLVSGTARFMGAMMNLFKLVFGLVIGTYAAEFLLGLSPTYTSVTYSYPYWIQGLALIVITAAYTILMNVKKANIKWIFTAACFGFFSYRLILLYSQYPFLSTFFAAFVVSLLGSFYARFIKKPAITVLLPGITLLVPGSMGLKSLSLVLAEDTLLGMNTLIKVFFTGIAIVAGLLLGNIILPPKRNL